MPSPRTRAWSTCPWLAPLADVSLLWGTEHTAQWATAPRFLGLLRCHPHLVRLLKRVVERRVAVMASQELSKAPAGTCQSMWSWEGTGTPVLVNWHAHTCASGCLLPGLLDSSTPVACRCPRLKCLRVNPPHIQLVRFLGSGQRKVSATGRVSWGLWPPLLMLPVLCQDQPVWAQLHAFRFYRPKQETISRAAL